MDLFAQTLSQQGGTLSDRERLDWLRLARTENVGPVTFHRLLGRYGTAGQALEALPELSRRGGRMRPLNPPAPADIEHEIEELRSLGGRIVCACEDDYPLPLSAIEDAPPVLSILGNMRLTRKPCLAIVGARNASLNGRKFAARLARELGAAGQIIVSGLARGIDTAVHEGALDSGTIAVVAGGIDMVYPRENTALYNRIKEDGLIVAESPLGTEPAARLFPKRNRLVAGLSSGVVVVEATARSGSLITARLAAEQGRDVYAVPGFPGDPRAEGPNRLIRDGAMLVQDAADILQALSDYSGGGMRELPQLKLVPEPVCAEEPDADPETVQNAVLENLSHTPVAVDELVRGCGLSVPSVQEVLLELELAGRLVRLPGGRVSLTGE